MNILRRFLKPRKHPRFYTHKAAFVLIGADAEGKRKVQIHDISEGGCAFVYNGSKKDLEESGFLSLLSEDMDIPLLDRVDFVTASDIPLPQDDKTNEKLRRRGVKFKWLGVFDQQRLKDFIEQNAVCRAC